MWAESAERPKGRLENEPKDGNGMSVGQAETGLIDFCLHFGTSILRDLD